MIGTGQEAGRKTVVVLGMHRSGTSMTAGVLRKLGVFVGRRLVGRLTTNPLGHFEDRAFVELNNRILAAAGGDSFHPPVREAIMAQHPAFEEEIRDLLHATPCPLWGWKDPRTCLTIDLLYPHLMNPFFIVCHREARAVAASLLARNGLNIETGIQLKETYDARIEEFFAAHPALPRLDLDYEEAVADPEATVRSVITFLRIAVSHRKYRQALAMIHPQYKLQRMAFWVGLYTKPYEQLKQAERRVRHWRYRVLGRRSQ